MFKKYRIVEGNKNGVSTVWIKQIEANTNKTHAVRSNWLSSAWLNWLNIAIMSKEGKNE